MAKKKTRKKIRLRTTNGSNVVITIQDPATSQVTPDFPAAGTVSPPDRNVFGTVLDPNNLNRINPIANEPQALIATGVLDPRSWSLQFNGVPEGDNQILCIQTVPVSGLPDGSADKNPLNVLASGPMPLVKDQSMQADVIILFPFADGTKVPPKFPVIGIVNDSSFKVYGLIFQDGQAKSGKATQIGNFWCVVFEDALPRKKGLVMVQTITGNGRATVKVKVTS